MELVYNFFLLLNFHVNKIKLPTLENLNARTCLIIKLSSLKSKGKGKQTQTKNNDCDNGIPIEIFFIYHLKMYHRPFYTCYLFIAICQLHLVDLYKTLSVNKKYSSFICI